MCRRHSQSFLAEGLCLSLELRQTCLCLLELLFPMNLVEGYWVSEVCSSLCRGLQEDCRLTGSVRKSGRGKTSSVREERLSRLLECFGVSEWYSVWDSWTSAEYAEDLQSFLGSCRLCRRLLQPKGTWRKQEKARRSWKHPGNSKLIHLSVCLVVWLVVFEGTTSKEFVLVQRICYLLTYCRFLALEVEEM